MYAQITYLKVIDMKVFILVFGLWATSIQAETLSDELRGINALTQLLPLTYQFEAEYASKNYAKSCQIGRKMIAIMEALGQDYSKDVTWQETKVRVICICNRAKKTAAKNFLNCTKFKVIKFTCAGVSNFDDCMTIRFGEDYSRYESICI